MRLVEIFDSEDHQQEKNEYWDSFYSGVLYAVEDLINQEFTAVPDNVKNLIAQIFNDERFPDINNTAIKVANYIKNTQ